MLVSQAIAFAYREAAIKAIGTVPTAEEYEEGLFRLNGFVSSLFGAEIGENLSDWQVPSFQRSAPYASNLIAQPFPQNLSTFDQPMPPLTGEQDISSNPPLNSRLLWRSDTPLTIYLPEYPQDGARIALVNTGSTSSLLIDANGRMIEGSTSLNVLPSAAPRTWFYRADLANWQPIGQLVLTDETPLPAEFDSLIVTGTAIRLTSLDEIEPREGTVQIYKRLLDRCKQRYRQKGVMSYGGQNIVSSTQTFNYDHRSAAW